MVDMQCEQVFDILTRGPFPTGDRSDRAVERHLGRCQDCYRLAAALRPAVELFEEAIDSKECRDLPGYWGRLACEPPRSSQRGQALDNFVTRAAAGLLLSLVLAAVIWPVGILEWQSARPKSAKPLINRQIEQPRTALPKGASFLDKTTADSQPSAHE